MNLILLGAPGAGKGTQAELLTEELGIPSISTGNMLREAIHNETAVGLEAKRFMDAGLLVPDDVIIGIVGERVAQPDCAKGFILDGVPRTVAQADALTAAGIHIDYVVSLEIDDSVIEARMTGRLEVYHHETEALKSYYEALGKLKLVKGDQAIEAANREILRVIGA